MTNVNDDFEEDEDIIIQGSALHEHLSSTGYLDFESVTLPKTDSPKTAVSDISYLFTFIEGICGNINSIYLWITEESYLSMRQLSVISSLEALLDDHASTIHGFLVKHQYVPWKKFLQDTFAIGTTIFSHYIMRKYKNIPSTIFACSTIIYNSRIMYLRFLAERKLKILINMQNDLHRLCKSGLKILRHGYRLKLGSEKSSQKFYDLSADRLKYLQPLMESIIEFMENASSLFYRSSLIIINLLPANVKTEYLMTILDEKLFKINGEINYQMLKQLHNIYILVQSEMLQLLAIAYNIDTWKASYCKIPEMKLICIIETLIQRLMIHKNKLSNNINAYLNHTIEPIRYEFKGLHGSKWQDLYVHLDLTAHKIQLAYSNIQSILKELDAFAVETKNDNEIADELMKKMNEAYKEIDTARNFAEFSSLLIAKTRLTNIKQDISVEKRRDNNPDLPVITDKEPEIVDEVFEEYIKEEYLKPLYEETDDTLLQYYRFDKLLAKNFMSELKEALVDKHKSMSERESKALQRMYQNMLKDSQVDKQVNSNSNRINLQTIPPPPPLPDFNLLSPSSDKVLENVHVEDKYLNPKEDIKKSNFDETASVHDSIKTPMKDLKSEFSDILEINRESLSSMKTITNSFPPNFLKIEEETFVGSGENSEEESGKSDEENIETSDYESNETSYHENK